MHFRIRPAVHSPDRACSCGVRVTSTLLMMVRATSRCKRQHVTQVTLETLRPDDFSCGSPDQFGGDSHRVGRAHDRAFDDRVDLQFPRDGWHRLSGASVAA